MANVVAKQLAKQDNMTVIVLALDPPLVIDRRSRVHGEED